MILTGEPSCKTKEHLTNYSASELKLHIYFILDTETNTFQ